MTILSMREHQFDLVVSIVIYKPHVEHLRQTINSLSGTPLKIKIAIHDNSPKKSDFAFDTGHALEYFWNGINVGFGAGHNNNISKYADDASYFLILNPDAYFAPDLLPEMLRRMQKDPSIGLAIPKICSPSGEIQNVNRRLPRPQDYVMNFVNGKLGGRLLSTKAYERFLLKDINHDQPFECPVISGCFMLFRHDTLKTVGGFDERFFLYLEDTDLSRRTAKIAKTVVFSDLVAYHHWTRGAYKNVRLFGRFVGNLVRYFNKWGWVIDPERDLLNSNVSYYRPPEEKVLRNGFEEPRHL